jgi:hypothetical protein
MFRIERIVVAAGRRAVRAWPACAVVVAACVLAAGEAYGCPNCKDAVDTTDPDGLNLARGYFYSILLMLAMPTSLVTAFGLYVWREMRRQKREGRPLPGEPGGWHQPALPPQP